MLVGRAKYQSCRQAISLLPFLVEILKVHKCSFKLHLCSSNIHKTNT